MAGSVTAIILLFLAGFCLVRGLPGVIQTLRARTWRRVPGTVLGAGTAGYLGQAGPGHGRAAYTRSVVGYTYDVDGRTYTGSRAAFGTPLGFGAGVRGVAAAQAARHQPGASVDVWVSPSDPSQSVLRRSAPSSLAITAIGAVVLVLALLSL